MNLTGSHRIPLDTSSSEIVRALSRAGWEVVRLDGERSATKSELMDTFSEAFDLDSSFGANWDAVVDVLRTQAAENSGGLAVVLDHGEHLGPMLDTLVDIVNDLAAEGSRVGLHVRRRPAFFRSVP